MNILPVRIITDETIPEGTAAVVTTEGDRLAFSFDPVNDLECDMDEDCCCCLEDETEEEVQARIDSYERLCESCCDAEASDGTPWCKACLEAMQCEYVKSESAGSEL